MIENLLFCFASLNIFFNVFIVLISIIIIKGIILIFNKLNVCSEKTKKTKKTKKINKKHYKYYNDYVEEVNKRIKSNIEKFDKNILTISTFLLGLSLIFIKDIVGDEIPKNIEYIHSSWSYLLVSISMTITSFVVAWKDNETSLNYYYKELIEQKIEYKDKRSIYSYILEYSTFMSVIYLLLGMLYLYLFVKINF